MRFTFKTIPAFVLLTVLLVSPSCRKLDEDGGYYDEKTKTYKYVSIQKRGVKKSSLQVFSPVPGKPQQVYGIVTRIDNDAKSIWLKIEDRQPYMIIAERLSGGNRDDKNKEIRIQLKFVSPSGSVSRYADFRDKWQAYVVKQLETLLQNKQVLVEIDYEEGARKLWGVCYMVVQTDDGDRARNINLWMIQQGLSYYFIDRGTAEDDKKFRDAQLLARQYKYGIWKLQ